MPARCGRGLERTKTASWSNFTRAFRGTHLHASLCSHRSHRLLARRRHTAVAGSCCAAGCVVCDARGCESTQSYSEILLQMSRCTLVTTSTTDGRNLTSSKCEKSPRGPEGKELKEGHRMSHHHSINLVSNESCPMDEAVVRRAALTESRLKAPFAGTTAGSGGYSVAAG